MPQPTPPIGWRVDVRHGSAAELHARWPAVEEAPTRRAVSVCRVEASSVVLGSTQPESTIDAQRATASGVAVVRRRSGGGAVLVTADDPVWIDAWVPAADPLWRDDVGRSFDWLGATWVRALQEVGVQGVSTHHQGALARTRWAGLVCFGGVGSGEVVTAAGQKMVGLAQRRTRDGAWFHGACVLRWDPRPLVRLLALPASERRAASSDLVDAARGAADILEVEGHDRPLTREAMAAAFVGSLP